MVAGIACLFLTSEVMRAYVADADAPLFFFTGGGGVKRRGDGGRLQSTGAGAAV